MKIGLAHLFELLDIFLDIYSKDCIFSKNFKNSNFQSLTFRYPVVDRNGHTFCGSGIGKQRQEGGMS